MNQNWSWQLVLLCRYKSCRIFRHPVKHPSTRVSLQQPLVILSRTVRLTIYCSILFSNHCIGGCQVWDLISGRYAWHRYCSQTDLHLVLMEMVFTVNIKMKDWPLVGSDSKFRIMILINNPKMWRNFKIPCVQLCVNNKVRVKDCPGMLECSWLNANPCYEPMYRFLGQFGEKTEKFRQ